MSTTPLERAILTHYWTTPGPWKGGSENWNRLDHEIVDRMQALNLLRSEIGGKDRSCRIVANTDSLEIYMDALAAVPFPVLKWVMPSD